MAVVFVHRNKLVAEGWWCTGYFSVILALAVAAGAAWGVVPGGSTQDKGGVGYPVHAGGLSGPGPTLIAFIIGIKHRKCLTIVLSGVFIALF